MKQATVALRHFDSEFVYGSSLGIEEFKIRVFLVYGKRNIPEAWISQALEACEGQSCVHSILVHIFRDLWTMDIYGHRFQ